jgi:hypothetical protein
MISWRPRLLGCKVSMLGGDVSTGDAWTATHTKPSCRLNPGMSARLGLIYTAMLSADGCCCTPTKAVCSPRAESALI